MYLTFKCGKSSLSVRLGLCVLFAGLICIVLQDDAAAQRGSGQNSGSTQSAPKSDVQAFRGVKTWYLFFKVTVKGSGTNSFDEQGTGSITWKFDDGYSGNIPLDSRAPYTKPSIKTPGMTPQQIAVAAIAQLDSLIQWTHFPVGVQRVPPFRGIFPIHIKIDEGTIVVNRDPCGGDVKTTTTSYGVGDDFSFQPPFFKTDLGTITYNVNIPLRGEGDDQFLTRTQTVEEKTDGKPTSSTTPPRKVPFKLFNTLPIVADLLGTGQIHHAVDRPLDAVSGTWDFDSGDLQPDKPMISGVADSQTMVKVRIYYKLSRSPITDTK